MHRALIFVAMLRKIVSIIMYSNIMVALGAGVATWSTSWLFHIHIPNELMYFLTFGVSCLYNLHWWIIPDKENRSPRIQWTYKNRNWVFIIIAISALASLYFLYQLPLHIQYYLVPAFIGSFIYIAPKIPFKPFLYLRSKVYVKTVFLSSVWTYTTVLMPILIAGRTIDRQFLSYLLYRYVLFHTVCFLFDYKDRDADAEAGIHSFLHQLSPKQAGYRIMIYLLIASIGMIMFQSYSLTPWGWVFGIPILILLTVKNYALNNDYDGLFYVVIDNTVFIVPWIMLLYNYS